jgi:hypothetical protein
VTEQVKDSFGWVEMGSFFSSSKPKEGGGADKKQEPVLYRYESRVTRGREATISLSGTSATINRRFILWTEWSFLDTLFRMDPSLTQYFGGIKELWLLLEDYLAVHMHVCVENECSFFLGCRIDPSWPLSRVSSSLVSLSDLDRWVVVQRHAGDPDYPSCRPWKTVHFNLHPLIMPIASASAWFEAPSLDFFQRMLRWMLEDRISEKHDSNRLVVVSWGFVIQRISTSLLDAVSSVDPDNSTVTSLLRASFDPKHNQKARMSRVLYCLTSPHTCPPIANHMTRLSDIDLVTYLSAKSFPVSFYFRLRDMDDFSARARLFLHFVPLLIPEY